MKQQLCCCSSISAKELHRIEWNPEKERGKPRNKPQTQKNIGNKEQRG